MRPRDRPRATAGSHSAVRTGATRRSGAASPVGTRDGLFCCSAPRSSSRALARRRRHPGVTRRVETRRRPPRLRPERSCHCAAGAPASYLERRPWNCGSQRGGRVGRETARKERVGDGCNGVPGPSEGARARAPRPRASLRAAGSMAASFTVCWTILIAFRSSKMIHLNCLYWSRR